MVEEVVQVWGESWVMVVLAVEVDALCRMAWRLRQAFLIGSKIWLLSRILNMKEFFL